MVKVNSIFAKLLAGAAVVSTAVAHPGEAHDHEEHAREISKRDAHASNIARGLEACQEHPNYIALQKRAGARRAVKAKTLRQKRDISLNSESSDPKLPTYQYDVLIAFCRAIQDEHFQR